MHFPENRLSNKTCKPSKSREGSQGRAKLGSKGNLWETMTACSLSNAWEARGGLGGSQSTRVSSKR